jgi:hypothetical protein
MTSGNSSSMRKKMRIGVIMTYIYRNILFHTSDIDYSNVVWKKLKNMFDKIDKN